jgi:AbrB family looped-hinge helix DNA binding protein
MFLEEKMEDLKPIITEIKARGQLTIPKKIREKGQLEEGQVVSLIPVGDSVIVTPRRLSLDEARREMKKILRQTGLSVDEVLAGIREERGSIYKETYGRKTG